MNKKGLMGNLVGGFIGIIVGIALLPNISDITNSFLLESNVTNISEGLGGGGTNTLLSLVPIFFVLAMVGMGLATVFTGLKNAGVLGGGSSDEDEEEDEEEEEEEEEDEVCADCEEELDDDDDIYACENCRKTLCEDCIGKYKGKELCKDCYKQVRERDKIMQNTKTKKVVEKVIKKEPKEEVKPIYAKKNKFEEKSKFE